MGQIFKFLQALARMAKKGDIKIDDAYRAAKQEFGEVNDLLKLQINKIFKESKAPSIKQPKKEGEVIEASFKPGMDKRGKIVEESPSQASGIMKTDEAGPLMKNIEDVKQNIKGMSENNPKTFRMTEEQRNALGYPNRMIEGIIRTAAREILSKKGIDVSKADPIDTFADIFGVNSLERLEDVSDELLAAQDYTQLNSILQKNELYDVTPKSGLNLKQSDEIEELTEFDPTDREPNAMGGINRIAYRDGTKIPKLINAGKKGLDSLKNAIGKIKARFGEDSITTADKISQPPKTDRQIISEFEARNPNPSRELTDNEIADLAEEVGELDAYDFDGTVGSANRIRNEAKDYQDEMYQQYKMGKLDPEPGDKSPARKMFLEKKLEEMLLSDDPKLMTKDEIEELTFFDMGTEIDQMRKSKPKSIIPKDEYAEYKKDFDKEILGKEIEEGVDPVAEAIDNVSPGFANDLKYDAQLVADDLAEKRFGKEFYDLDQNQQINLYDEAYQALSGQRSSVLKKKREPIPESIKEGVDDVMRDTSPAGLERSLEVDDLMLKYPGINRDLAKQIANDPDPKRKADVISMIEQTFKMDEMGMSGDEIIDTFRKKTDRTKQANGGLSYLMGM